MTGCFGGPDSIRVRGARTHNLKNVSVDIPRGALTVVTGVSGSGKSSLAFDTVFAEGRRRYLESLPAYARRFIDRMDRPDVDSVEGLSPAIAISQFASAPGPRSILATSAEVHEFFRLLFAHMSQPHCPSCGRPIRAESPELVSEKLLAMPEGTRITILSPIIRKRSGGGPATVNEALRSIRAAGFVRVRINGTIMDIEDAGTERPGDIMSIEAVVDRIVIRSDIRSRLSDSVETAMKHARGSMTAIVRRPDSGAEEILNFSERNECPDCGVSFDALKPSSFSFNSHAGACPGCEGLGRESFFDETLVVPDGSLSLAQGAVRPWRRGPKRLIAAMNMILRSVAAWQGVDMDTPWNELPESAKKAFLYGSNGEELLITRKVRGSVRRVKQTFEGVIPNLERRLRESESDEMKSVLRTFMSSRTCSLCHGARMRPEILACTVPHPEGPCSIAQVMSKTVSEALRWVSTLTPDVTAVDTSGSIIPGLKSRLGFLERVGLGYLTLDRESSTLSGGEMQRVRLASQIGAGLSGVLYVLDEPTIGLHPADTGRLLDVMQNLKELGNTLLVVEHDEEVIRAADYIIDVGPGAGSEGGGIVYAGQPDNLRAAVGKSLTADFLYGTADAGKREPREVRPDTPSIVVHGARLNNLRSIDVSFPIGRYTVVTGVSGSGKSSLVNDVLCANAERMLRMKPALAAPFGCSGITGLDNIAKIIVVGASPAGKSDRSNLLTVTGGFDTIRGLFASTPTAKARGYGPARFSFNVKGGRCEVCRGVGTIQLEMSFLPDVSVTCPQCGGRRYNRETLEVHYAGKSISDILDMTVDGARAMFENIPVRRRKFECLQRAGLGYLALGQPVSSLSGGETQRLKLSAELSRPSSGSTLYVLDEPTSGLHFADVGKLLNILLDLRDAGNTVIVIEHNPDMIKAADHVIDLGPGGGGSGGRLVFAGTVAGLRQCTQSLTGLYV